MRSKPRRAVVEDDEHHPILWGIVIVEWFLIAVIGLAIVLVRWG